MPTKTKKIATCSFCEQKFQLNYVCPKCSKRDIHHGQKVPTGLCQQCLKKTKSLTKAGTGKYYCPDCLKWNQEAEQTGIGTYGHRFLESYCKNCGKCTSCQTRKELARHSTQDLMIEVMERAEFEALLSWEDDWFKRRYGEIIWELDQVKHLAPKQIEKLVDQDIFEKPMSKRRFSRGT